MKPTKNRYFCLESGKTKMLFPTESKAKAFIRFNGDDIVNNGGRRPTRAYFCAACGGWHITCSKRPTYVSEMSRYLDSEEYTRSKTLQIGHC